ncbi:aldose epimerase family protein [Echinimonas agarilytica]|uniref:Aldose 1-epimerase n=1 Tax=Echinimonas agarilytica TaxID=1215918 RepID=A0AA41W434_9GAMM|nr:aldose epimerase family protein [Echinimonas agarilytica]MCM2678417.1 galactose mutarotase [Echinimonas agarilytica]
MDITTQITIASGDVEVDVLPWGGTIRAIRFRHQGELMNTVLSYDKPEMYRIDPFYMGCTPGRYANRIARAEFKLKGVTHKLTANENGNILHGGRYGFQHQPWQVIYTKPDEVALQYVSRNGEQGFPGQLTVKQTIRATEDSVSISYYAETSAATVVNLTNHCYFNLDREKQYIGDHWLQINASQFTEVNEQGIPTGHSAPVNNTPFDFRQAQQLAKVLDAKHPQLQHSEGFDHNFEIEPNGNPLHWAAILYSPQTDLSMTVLSTQPGLQLYCGQYLTGPFKPKQGLCLEAQQFPDAPNQPHFPNAEVHPGKPYQERIVYRFSQGHQSK